MQYPAPVLRILTAIAVIAAAASGACSAAESPAAPSADPFTGAYTLSAVGPATVPGMIYVYTNGGYGIVREGQITFSDLGHVVFSSIWETRDSASAPTVVATHVDTFALGRVPTQGFAIRRTAANDTVAVITIPAFGRLTWNYRSTTIIGSYTFVRR
jgi:hypothetical protein